MRSLRLHKVRDQDRQRRLKAFAQLATSVYSIPLFLFFWFADLVYVPEKKWLYLGLRIGNVICYFLCNRWVQRARDLRATQLRIYGLVVLNVVPIIAMILLTGDLSSPYYAGLNLIALGVAVVGWTREYFALCLATIYLPLPAIASAIGTVGWNLGESTFFLNSVFMIGTAAIAAAVWATVERLMFQDFVSKARLSWEVDRRGKEIERRTAQSLRLRALSEQFSPQIVRLIQTEGERFFDQVRSTTVAVLFVDIVGSTERVLHLDPKQLNEVIRFYVGDTLSVLNKYDMTIEAILGDGISAVSNDPFPQEDYVERAVSAALEIRARIDRRREEYLRSWGKVFSVRIGIANGHVLASFRGPDAQYQNYSVLGPPVTLAAEISAAMAPGEIGVSSEIRLSLDHRKKSLIRELDWKPGPSLPTSHGALSIFKIVADTLPAEAASDAPSCPHGHGVMHLERGVDGIYRFECHLCAVAGGLTGIPGKAA